MSFHNIMTCHLTVWRHVFILKHLAVPTLVLVHRWTTHHPSGGLHWIYVLVCGNGCQRRGSHTNYNHMKRKGRPDNYLHKNEQFTSYSLILKGGAADSEVFYMSCDCMSWKKWCWYLIDMIFSFLFVLVCKTTLSLHTFRKCLSLPP